MTIVGVVLPFYQRDQGLLTRALRSVFAQSLPEDIRLLVVVVDDESPTPPEPELEEFAGCDTETYPIVLLKQSNAGPGAARNRGLDHFRSNPVDFVAFLDTDDIWHPAHLRTALTALGADRDYYFANHYRDSFEGGGSYFERSPTVAKWLTLGPESPVCCTADPEIFALRRESQFFAFMSDYLSQTSTVVYRYDTLGSIRFDVSLRTAGEDLLFWLSLASTARMIVFTTRPTVSCGSGVNIFHATLNWDHPNTPDRFAYQLMLWRYVSERFDLNAAERTIVLDKVRGFERGFSYIWVRGLVRSGKPNLKLIRILKHRIGWSPWRIIPGLACSLRRRAFGAAMFPEH